MVSHEPRYLKPKFTNWGVSLLKGNIEIYHYLGSPMEPPHHNSPFFHKLGVDWSEVSISGKAKKNHLGNWRITSDSTWFYMSQTGTGCDTKGLASRLHLESMRMDRNTWNLVHLGSGGLITRMDLKSNLRMLSFGFLNRNQFATRPPLSHILRSTHQNSLLPFKVKRSRSLLAAFRPLQFDNMGFLLLQIICSPRGLRNTSPCSLHRFPDSHKCTSPKQSCVYPPVIENGTWKSLWNPLARKSLINGGDSSIPCLIPWGSPPKNNP